MQLLYNVEIVRALRFNSLLAFLKCHTALLAINPQIIYNNKERETVVPYSSYKLLDHFKYISACNSSEQKETENRSFI